MAASLNKLQDRAAAVAALLDDLSKVEDRTEAQVAEVAKLTAEIQDSVKQRKGSVQSPKQVIVVDSVPVTALGKPDKKTVRAKFWEGTGRAIG